MKYIMLSLGFLTLLTLFSVKSWAYTPNSRSTPEKCEHSTRDSSHSEYTWFKVIESLKGKVAQNTVDEDEDTETEPTSAGTGNR